MKLLSLIASLLSPFAYGEAIPWSTEKIVRAIYIAEGGHLTRYPYGIKSVKVRNAQEAYTVCVRTVENARTDWGTHGRFRHKCFITYLGMRYCPPGVDPVGNRNWVKNVKYWLRN
jgi:hypothetical protein